jgi:hypothetical protein
MKDLLTATIKWCSDADDPTAGEPLTVRAWTCGPDVQPRVTVQLGYAAPMHLDWSEADALSSMLSDAAEAIFEEVTR